jgi:molybdopterin-guanine dinucleotide biosynthesis protein A
VYNIAGVILAGGSNRRFNGITKSNILIDGKSIISRMADTIGDIFDEKIIVTNTPGEFNEFTSFKITGDQFMNAGPLGGIHAAMKASIKEALFVFAGDMPLLDREVIIRQIDYFINNRYDILIPRIDQLIEPLHSIYRNSLVQTLEEFLTGNKHVAVRDLFKKVNTSYFEVAKNKETKYAFMNINSPSDVSLAEKILKNR